MSEKMRLLGLHIREAAISAAREGFRDASLSGLCSEGAQEAAISAIQKLDIDMLIQEFESHKDID
jgi:hypothetical protein